MNTSKTKFLIILVAGVGVVAGIVVLSQSGRFAGLFAGQQKEGDTHDNENKGTPIVYRKPLGAGELALPDGKGDPGLRITDETRKGLRLETAEVVRAVAKRAMPPQLGTINFDNESMLQIKPRFP